MLARGSRLRLRVSGSRAVHSYPRDEAGNPDPFQASLFIGHEPRVPHISPSFGEMWELTDAGASVLAPPENFQFESSCLYKLITVAISLIS
jgi:hypothetical protein